MKILNIEKIREADEYTINNEPIPSINLMERAANVCTEWIEKHYTNNRRILIFCGLGNNGGDGLAIARLLFVKNYMVTIYVVKYSNKYSDDFKINYDRLSNLNINNINDINQGDILPVINPDDIVIDAIFGSGLTKPVKGFPAEIINHINSSKAEVISIDVPSGLFCDHSSQILECSVIRALYTLSFQLPKFAFMFAENEKYVGNWHILNIGISEDFIAKTPTVNHFIEIKDIINVYRPRKKFAHKGNFGHALLIAGSYGKIGAAVLGSKAALRSGAGLVSVHTPRCGYQIIQTAVPEAMVSIDKHENLISDINDFFKYDAIAIGPGIGNDIQTQNALKKLISESTIPLIIDADAINILGENKNWSKSLPKNSILTPHPKEFERITRKADNDFHRNTLQREFSLEYKVYVILKGAYTCISSPEGKCWFNSSGNPGMATAGSGDVLTGILLGLMAQSYNQLEVCLMGVYLHGLAGDFAMKNKGHESLIAGDIIDNLGSAFCRLY